MSRGQGIEIKKEYNWAKQPNGRYTIFDIPIFAAFNDKSRGQATMADLRRVVANFIQDKNRLFRYPRVHIGHHGGTENRPGVGYLDNLYERGGTIFADLVEIDPDTFQQMQKDIKFPYVSPEYHSEKNKILTVALLESQPPYFPFPMIALKNAPVQVSENQSFMFACRSQVLCFQEQKGCPCMADEPISPNPDDPKDQMVDEGKQYKCAAEPGLGEKLDRIVSLLEQIFQWEKAEHEMGEQENEPSEPASPEENEMGNPSSVAYQQRIKKNADALIFQAMTEELHAVNDRLARLEQSKSASQAQERLRMVCERRGLNFDEHSGLIEKFSSEKDRNVYIDALEARKPLSAHPATKFAQTFQMDDLDPVIKKYQDQPDWLRTIARRAYQTYRETISHGNEKMAKKFAAMWPSAQKFVDHVVEFSRETPNYLDKMIMP